MAKYKFFLLGGLLVSALMLWGQPSFSAATEGLSRQIQAMRDMMSSFKGAMDTRLEALELRENQRTACFNQSKLYWPNHDEADGNGCVAQDDIASGTGFDGCMTQSFSWSGYGGSCTAVANFAEVGETVTITDGATTPSCSYSPEYVGTATLTCTDTGFVIDESTCHQRNFNHCR